MGNFSDFEHRCQTNIKFAKFQSHARLLNVQT